MTIRQNADRAPIDRIDLMDHRSDEHGWPYAVMLGTDSDRGWVIEADMQRGEFVAAFTPAGVDPLFLIEAKESEPNPGSRFGRVTTATIRIEGGSAVWDEATQTLTITNG